jgi:hypothetical protein
MKAMSHGAGTWDRIATREELSQVIDLLESLPSGRDLGRSQTPGFPVPLAGTQASDDSESLWLDSSEDDEDAGAQNLNASLESLAQLFANHGGLVN